MNAVKRELSACFDFVEHSVQNGGGGEREGEERKKKKEKKKTALVVRSHKIASKDIMFEISGFPAARHIQP